MELGYISGMVTVHLVLSSLDIIKFYVVFLVKTFETHFTASLNTTSHNHNFTHIILQNLFQINNLGILD